MQTPAVPRKPGWPEPTRPEHQPAQQHFQARDRWVEELLAFRIDAVAPRTWGLSQLTIDTAALAKRVLRVTHLTGRFPSGAPAIVTPRRPMDLELRLPRTGGGAISVELALAPHSIEGPSVAEDGVTGRALRYRRVAGPESFLAPRIQLQSDDGGDVRYERIPLARVLTYAGQMTLDSDFLPPMIRMLPASFLPRAVDDVCRALAARQAELFAAREARPFSIHDFEAEAPAFLVLSAISQALAGLGELRNELDPRELYATLSELLGALEALGDVPLVEREIASYSHVEAGPLFRTVLARLHRIVPQVASAPHRAFRLGRVDASTFSGSLEDAETLGSEIYLVASGPTLSEAVLSHLPAQAKIASRTRLPAITGSAISGVPLGAEFDPPRSIPSSRTHFCFRLNTRSEFWNEIVASRAIAVHLPNPPAQLELVLYAAHDRRR